MLARLFCQLIFWILIVLDVTFSLLVVVLLYIPMVGIKAVLQTVSGKARLGGDDANAPTAGPRAHIG